MGDFLRWGGGFDLFLEECLPEVFRCVLPRFVSWTGSLRPVSCYLNCMYYGAPRHFPAVDSTLCFFVLFAYAWRMRVKAWFLRSSGSCRTVFFAEMSKLLLRFFSH